MIYDIRMDLSGSEFRQFYKETQPKLVRWLRRRVGEEKDAEELCQDTFISLIDSLPAFRGKSSLWTFLISIARHEVADYWRKRYAKKAILTVPFIDQVYTEKLQGAEVVAEEIERIYHKLLPEERVILIWKYEENLSVAQIATKLKIGIKAAESRLFRARNSFKLAYAISNGDKI